jgi:hypothetical protein
VTLSDRLRSEITMLIGNQPVGEVARDMKISRMALWRFLSGKTVKSDTLDSIDRWRRTQVLRK